MSKTPNQVSEDFWNSRHEKGERVGSHNSCTAAQGDEITKRALIWFGDIKDKRLLDIGFGSGDASIYFARMGAEVTAVDISPIAVEKLNKRAEALGLENLKAYAATPDKIPDLGPFDLVYGALILHHIEPFDEFVTHLKSAMPSNSKGFFYENSARSRMLIWFRTHLVGRLWVPKYGDPYEFPLTEKEVQVLAQHFDVRREISELIFFQLISVYLLRGALLPLFQKIDNYFFRFTWARRFSYFQNIFLRS